MLQDFKARNAGAVRVYYIIHVCTTDNVISGGNDASIVLPDVDIAKTAPEVAIGAFFNSGQACIATKRIYIHESIYKPFIEAMVNFTKNLKVGSSDEAGIILGPIQNNMQSEKVKQFFTDSKKHGYTFAAGKPEVETSKGFFIHPAIIDNPPNDSMIIQEEPFGKPFASRVKLLCSCTSTVLTRPSFFVFRAYRTLPTLDRRRRSHQPRQ